MTSSLFAMGVVDAAVRAVVAAICVGAGSALLRSQRRPLGDTRRRLTGATGVVAGAVVAASIALQWLSAAGAVLLLAWALLTVAHDPALGRIREYVKPGHR